MSDTLFLFSLWKDIDHSATKEDNTDEVRIHAINILAIDIVLFVIPAQLSGCVSKNHPNTLPINISPNIKPPTRDFFIVVFSLYKNKKNGISPKRLKNHKVGIVKESAMSTALIAG